MQRRCTRREDIRLLARGGVRRRPGQASAWPDLGHLRAVVRFDRGWWRRVAELGCGRRLAWFKRTSPPFVAALVFGLAGDERAAVLRNQRQVRGRRGWLRERWDAYRVFTACARSMTEGLEQWGSRRARTALEVPETEVFRSALDAGRGLVVPTAHLSGWDVAARFLAELGRPLNLVTTHAPNPVACDLVHRLRSRHRVNVIYSDPSAFAALPVLHALRREEVVAIQIDPAGGRQAGTAIEFCDRPAAFDVAAFTIARMARAPVIPVFAVRTGFRRYEMRTAGRFDPRTKRDTIVAFAETVRVFERLVRAHPAQWLAFEDAWRDAPAAPGHGDERMPGASRARRR